MNELTSFFPREEFQCVCVYIYIMVKIKQLDCYFSFFFVNGWISSRDTLYLVSLLLSIYLLDCSVWITDNFIVNPTCNPILLWLWLLLHLEIWLDQEHLMLFCRKYILSLLFYQAKFCWLHLMCCQVLVLWMQIFLCLSPLCHEQKIHEPGCDQPSSTF